MSGLVIVKVVDECIVGLSNYAVMLWVTRGKFPTVKKGVTILGIWKARMNPVVLG